MIVKNNLMPIVGIDGNSLANTSHKWKCGNEWFEYARNSQGYRSEEFQSNPEFLFAGCSETFGESAKYETTWAYKLYNKVKNDQSTYCNIGLPGIGVPIVIYNVLEFIEKYGKPKNLFIVFPNFRRTVEVNDNKFSTLTVSAKHKGHDQVELERHTYTDKQVVEATKTSNIVQIKTLELLCKILNINFIWSTWCYESHSIVLQNNVFNNYVNILDSNDISDLAMSLGYNTKDIKLNRADGDHHGEIFHDYWSNVFYSKYKENKK